MILVVCLRHTSLKKKARNSSITKELRHRHIFAWTSARQNFSHTIACRFDVGARRLRWACRAARVHVNGAISNTVTVEHMGLFYRNRINSIYSTHLVHTFATANPSSLSFSALGSALRLLLPLDAAMSIRGNNRMCHSSSSCFSRRRERLGHTGAAALNSSRFVDRRMRVMLSACFSKTFHVLCKLCERY